MISLWREYMVLPPRLSFCIRRFSLFYLLFRNVSLRSTGFLSVKRMDTLHN